MTDPDTFPMHTISLEERTCDHLDRLAQIQGAADIGQLAVEAPHMAYLHIYRVWARLAQASGASVELLDDDLHNTVIQFSNQKPEDARAITTVMGEALPPLLSIERPFWLVVNSFRNRSILDMVKGRQVTPPSIKVSYLVEPYTF
ncbi:hypothetical protein H7Y63_01255 [Polaromonas sp.]|nr:hypothetical protein [Candidatus Saccharibacteria bacterium]